MKTSQVMGIAIIVSIVIIVTFLLIGNPSNSTPSVKIEKTGSSSIEGDSSSLAGQVSHTVVLNGLSPQPVEKILVYKVVHPQYTRQDIISLGEKFNMSASDKIKESPTGFGIMKEDHSLHVYLTNSGSTEFSNTNRAQTVNPLDIPGNLPSDEEAEKIATKFLRERGLLPDGAVFIGTEHGKMTIHPRDGNEIVTWEDVQVWYGRELNGLKVKGTKISIDVGGGGDIIDFYSNWREYEPYKELPVKSPDTAFEELKIKGVPVGMNTPDSVSIDDVYLAYRSKPGAQTEEYLEPVWVFKGDVMVADKSVKQVEAYIPALTDDAVKSLSSP
jgi:hypothetical protein